MLKELIKQMKDCINNGDTECAHSNADDLLIEALKLLGKNNKQVDELIDCWYKVDKWYA